MKITLTQWLGIAAVLSVVGIVLATKDSQPVVYEKEDSSATEPAVETPAWMQDEDAIAAAEAVVKRKQLETERAEVQAQIEALEAREAEIEQALGF